MITNPVIRYHGGKFRLAPWIIEHMPPHQTYVEPFGGAAGVLMQKPRSYAEVYNDLDGEIVNLFRVMQDPAQRDRLAELLVCTPYARSEFELAFELTSDPVEIARRTIIRAEMGFGSAGATKGSTGFRIDTARKYATAQHIWLRFPERLAGIGQRLAGVLIENRNAIEVMLNHDSPETLHFVDPPYVHSTRSLGGNRYYRHEMSDSDHQDLLNTLKNLKGMIILSGYQSDLYSKQLQGWIINSKSVACAAGRGSAKRQESIWLNPACADALNQRGLPLEVTA
ncbi:DNA adenine methylase [Halopseudomonas phragmitis]|uniref:DNA methyltransferase n=1 Tax=Halopseudomonas phragmitis TaxID=1931241 RepID=A0A1V0B0F1_9GAMM|nr:DNA adenine methylase [Halopseudomonas phragmitis]AQZ93254.1 DNA methyltransferase [Halopseudomonas phragmitis]